MTRCSQLYGTHTGVNLARKHIGWYTKGLPGSAELRNRVNQQDDPAVVMRMLQRILFALACAHGRLTTINRATSVFLMQRPSGMLGPRRMDARTAESPVISRAGKLAPAGAGERAILRPRSAVLIGLFLIGMIGFSVWLLRRGAEPGTLLSPPLIALLLIANLLPAIALMVLYARKVAVRRAEQGGLGSGRLHVRLVALFSVIAAVPTVLVAIFASLLFQSGLEFWFSNRARGMLENTVPDRAERATTREVERVANETVDDERATSPAICDRCPSTTRDSPRHSRRSRCSTAASPKRSSSRRHRRADPYAGPGESVRSAPR